MCKVLVQWYNGTIGTMVQWYNELTSLSHTTVVNEREDFFS